LRGTFIINPEGKLLNMEMNFYNLGRNIDEMMRKFKANIYMIKKTNEVCPSKWKNKGDRLNSWRMAVSWQARRHDSHPHLGLQLPGMPRVLLSGEVPHGQDAPVLRGAVLHGGDQLHLLSDAQRQDHRGMGRGDPRRLLVHPQGASAHHSH